MCSSRPHRDCAWPRSVRIEFGRREPRRRLSHTVARTRFLRSRAHTHLAPIADNRPQMPVILLIGPAVAVIGLVAVVFVMRHKSVEKRSMYSARRSQIEHKVRAARQRTMAPVNK